MGSDRQSVPVSLPSELVEELDALVEADLFGSRSEALRYGARLVVREERQARIAEETVQDTRDELSEVRFRVGQKDDPNL